MCLYYSGYQQRTWNFKENFHEFIGEKWFGQLPEEQFQKSGHIVDTVLAENALNLVPVVGFVVLVVTLVEHVQFIFQIL